MNKNKQHILLQLFFVLLVITEVYSEEISCPKECHCTIDGFNFMVDCSNANLMTLPEFKYKNVQFLDLSNNLFDEFPKEITELQGLEFLDLSHNQISSLQENSLAGLTSLRVLDLGYNNITNWQDISPNELLIPTLELLELNLAGNHFTSFTSNDEKLILFSQSLVTLDLSNCKIVKVSGEFILSGLRSLAKLNLSKNPLHSISDLVSDSLGSLDLSHCRLTMLHDTVFLRLSNLYILNLSHNNGLSLSMQKHTKSKAAPSYVQSNSLNVLDVSHCNMDSIVLQGFQNLTTVLAQYNMIRTLNKATFSNNKLLKDIFFSMNSISHIASDTFQALPHLTVINLSYNAISQLDRDAFKNNSHLTGIDLSHNFLSRLSRINAPSVVYLNVSGCEILSLDRDIFGGMPLITSVDLSLNLLSQVPPYLSAKSLSYLYLRNNRILSIKNSTFNSLPELIELDLSGNRLTIPMKRERFSHLKYLQKIWLGDNPWICDCDRTGFLDFYHYLTEMPIKIMDRYNMKCSSPENLYGHTWESACYRVWFPTQRNFGPAERVFITMMVVVIVFSAMYCCYMSIKKGLEGRELSTRERERQESCSEAAEIARDTRVRLQQEAQLNAPDPREHHPPAYEDAIRMPKPRFSSMDELSTRRSKRKRHGRKSTKEVGEEDEVPIRRHRYRSEEVLSPRTSRIPPRLHPFEMEALERTREVDNFYDVSPSQSPTEDRDEYCTFESRNGSPYTKRRGDDSSRRNSPFKRRDVKLKEKRLVSSQVDPELSAESESFLVKPSDVATIVMNIKKSKENLNDDALPGPSLSPEASECLEEEFKLLDKQLTEKHKPVSDSRSTGSSGSVISSNEAIEVLSSEDIEYESAVKLDKYGQEYIVVSRPSNQR